MIRTRHPLTKGAAMYKPGHIPGSPGPSPGTNPETEQDLALALDTSIAHPARRYNYWLGGKDNFAVDRASGDAIAAAFPSIRLWAVENRRFLRRAVTFLATEAGIDQFLDIGTGIPTADNTHEVAQRTNPASRVVYVDNDPIVLIHARALLAGHADGVTAYLHADLRDPDAILTDPVLTSTLDLSRPVALILSAVLHFIRDEHHPYKIMQRLTGALAPGSYLTISHSTPDFVSPEKAHNARAAQDPNLQPRSRDEFARFFDSLDLVPPGITSIAEWRADDEPKPRPSAADISAYGAIGRIP
jgi:hypothetical protein